MDVYDRLGVTKVVNGAATLTRLGGSLMPPVVLEAMAEAAQHFVDMDDLQTKVGRQIAEWTHNEAAFVSCGAAAGLALSAAACIAGTDSEKRARLPYSEGMANQVIVHKHNRVGYDFAMRQAGARLVEIGGADGTATAAELEAAITDETAAILYFYNVNRMGGMVPLEQGIGIAQRHDVPLIVDAAAQIPPVENLWRFTHMGADLALFSGGKGLRGPQSSGLILGRKDLIEACAFHACPNAFIGRPMKVGKEEMIGLMTAVRWYLDQDQQALMQRYEDQCRYAIEVLGALPHVTARRSFPSEAGQPMPRAEILLDEVALGLTGGELLTRLREGSPSIALQPAGKNGVYLNPQTLEPGQERIVVDRIVEVLGH
jgi:L-seryl-tRNA(Ser) seleniumtransferase